jgi:hypothetical protein
MGRKKKVEEDIEDVYVPTNTEVDDEIRHIEEDIDDDEIGMLTGHDESEPGYDPPELDMDMHGEEEELE